ncbi:MAG: YihA family ribosome biogenesis GTP-binding protein [Campylobacterales bacterium]|nr:YihA family ribosome biogenesis GTP-binding protein [Campylobacterales bacterium]
MIEIIDAVFELSAPDITKVPHSEQCDEVAFLARSNTGKSSLLNTLTKRKSLAKVSATPGKTQLINYYGVTFLDRENAQKRQARFVDLPGFGYAKVSKSIKSDWNKNLTAFIEQRKQIRLFVHLIDARHPDLEIDHSVRDFLAAIQTPAQETIVVFTKIDKLTQKELSLLRKAHPQALLISNLSKRGIETLTQHVYHTLFPKENHE